MSNQLSVRTVIEQFEQAMEKYNEAEKLNSEGLYEYQVDGSYIRQLFIPKETILTTQKWKKERLWIIPYGHVYVRTELGDYEIEGPYVGLAPTKEKVIIYTFTDTLWLAVTGIDESKDIEDQMLWHG